ncbi:MAG: hypothetical protein ACK5Q5_15705 [Planctomycetaceae bacterium]
MSADSLSRVIVFARPDDPADLRDVLQSALQLNKIDAGLAVHHAPGILPRSWPSELAQSAATAITQAGLRAVAVPAGDIPDFSQARHAHHIRCEATGLVVCDLSGQAKETLPWDRLRLLSIGRVPLDKQRHYVTDTITHANPVPPDEYLQGDAIRGLEGWLLFDEPRQILHVDSEHQNYEYLGSRMTTSGPRNFDLLVADLAQLAQTAFVTPATRKYLTNGPVLDFDFTDSAALQEYTLVEYFLFRELQG